MSCKPQYKGIRYNSLEELYRANGINKQQKQQAQQKFQEYINVTGRQDIEGFKNFVQNINEQHDSDLQSIMLYDNLLSSIENTNLMFSDDALDKIVNSRDKNELLKSLMEDIDNITNKQLDISQRAKSLENILSMMDEGSKADILSMAKTYIGRFNVPDDNSLNYIINRYDEIDTNKLMKRNLLDNLYYFLEQSKFKQELYNDVYQALMTDDKTQLETETQEEAEERIEDEKTVEAQAKVDEYTPEYVNAIAKKYGGNENINRVVKIMRSVLNNRYLPYGSGLSSSMTTNYYKAVYKVYEDLINGVIDTIPYAQGIVDIYRDGLRTAVNMKDLTLEDITNPDNRNNLIAIRGFIIVNISKNNYSFLSKEERMALDPNERKEVEDEIRYFLYKAFPEVSFNSVLRAVEEKETQTSKTTSRRFDDENIAPEKALNSLMKSVLSSIPKNMVRMGHKEFGEDFVPFQSVVSELNLYSAMIKEQGGTFTMNGFVDYLKQASEIYIGQRGRNTKAMYDFFMAPLQLDNKNKMVGGIMRYLNTNDIVTEAIKLKLDQDEVQAIMDKVYDKKEAVNKLLQAIYVSFSGVIANQAMVANTNGDVSVYDVSATTIDKERIKNNIKAKWGKPVTMREAFNGEFSSTDVQSELADKNIMLSSDNNTISVKIGNEWIDIKIQDSIYGQKYGENEISYEDVMKYIFDALGFDKIGLLLNAERNNNKFIESLKNNMFSYMMMVKYNEEASSYIAQLKEVREKYAEMDLDRDAEYQEKQEILNSIPKSFYELKKKMSGLVYLKWSDFNMDGIELFIPTSDAGFIDKYVQAVMSYDSVGSRNQYEKADGSTESLLTTGSPFASFMESSDSVKNKIENVLLEKTPHRELLKQKNLVANGDMKFGKAVLLGGYKNEYTGKQQKELSTSELLDLLFNRIIFEGILPKSARTEFASGVNMVSLTDINSDRGSIYYREYTIGNKPLFTAKFNNNKTVKELTPVKETIVENFTKIAEYYKGLQALELNKLTALGLAIQDGYIVKDGQVVTRDKKALYYGLEDNFHILFDRNGNAMAGNIFTFNNLSFNPKLIDILTGKSKVETKYEQIVDLFLVNEASSLAELLVDNSTSLSEFRGLVNTDEITTKIDAILNIQNNEETKGKKKLLLNKLRSQFNIKLSSQQLNYDLLPTNKAEYDSWLVESKELTTNINELQRKINSKNTPENLIGILEDLLKESIHERSILQSRINNFKKLLLKVYTSDAGRKDTKVNSLFEYAVLSFFFHNETLSQLSRGTSLRNGSISDYIKRGHGVTSPIRRFDNNDRMGVPKQMNVVLIEDMGAQFLGKEDSEAHTNGFVPVNPLMWERMRYSNGQELGDMGYGNIKTNLYDTGVFNDGSPLYLKMSQTTIKFDHIQKRSAFHLNLLDKFLNIDYNVTSYDFINGERVITESKVNLYNEFGFKEKLSKVRTEKQWHDLIKSFSNYLSEYDMTGNMRFNGYESQFDAMIHIVAPRSATKSFISKVQDNEANGLLDDGFNFNVPSVNSLGLPISDPSSFITVSTDNFGIQVNKQHGILEDKTLPTQILNIASVVSSEIGLDIDNALSNLTQEEVNKLREMVDNNEIYNELKRIAYSAALSSNSTMGKLEILQSGNTVADVILKDINSTAISKFNRIVKPNLKGGTFVQEPSLISVYEDKNGHVFTANSLGLENDSVSVEGYTRRKLKPVRFFNTTTKVEYTTREELLKAIDNGEKIGLRHQEIIMDFPYRKEFGIGKEQTLAEVTVFNGMVFRDKKQDEYVSMINELFKVETNLKGDAKYFHETFVIGNMKTMFKKNQGVVSIINKAINKESELKDLIDDIAEYFTNLNDRLLVYSVRVPTTNMSSGFPSKIVEFATGVENTVTVPSEKSILDGSDYDIDELHIYYKPFSTKNQLEKIQYDMFKAIHNSYLKPESLRYIISEINYKPYIEEADAQEQNSTFDRKVNSLPSMLIERQQQYDGKSMVGRLVTGQHSLLNLIVLQRKMEQNVVKSLDNFSLPALMDLYAAYINMATDNSKLGAPLGKLGHNTNLSELTLGVFINGIKDGTISQLSQEEQSKRLSTELTSILNHKVVKDALNKTEFTLGVQSGEYIQVFQSTFTESYSKYVEDQQAIIDGKYTLPVDKQKAQDNINKVKEIRSALAIGINAHRLYRFNLIQGTKATLYDSYRLKKDLEFYLDSTLDEFLNGEKKSYEQEGFEQEIRDTFNLPEYVRKSKTMMTQVSLFNTLYKSLENESIVLSKVDTVLQKMNLNNGGKKYKFTEEQHLEVLRTVESMLIAEYFKDNKHEVTVNINDNTILKLDLSETKNVERFLTLFENHVKLLKKRHKDNMFIHNLTVGQGSMKINYAERIDNAAIVDDYINSFNQLPSENDKQMFRIYSVLMNGFTDTQNSLSRFIDKSFVQSVSGKIKTNKEKYSKNIDESLNKGDISSSMIMLHAPSLQPRRYNEKSKISVGRASRYPSTSGRGFVANVHSSNETFFLNAHPQSRYLSLDNVSTVKALKSLTINEEIKLLNGESITKKTSGYKHIVTPDKAENVLRYATAVADNETATETKLTTVTIEALKNKDGDYTGVYVIRPVKQDDSNKRNVISKLNHKPVIVALSGLFNSSFSVADSYTMYPNGDIALSPNEIGLSIFEVKGLIANLKLLENFSNFTDVIQQGKELIKNQMMKEAMKEYFGPAVSMTDKNILSFFSRNNTRTKIKNVILATNKYDLKTVETFVENEINESLLESIEKGNKNTFDQLVTSLALSPQQTNILKIKGKGTSLIDIAQAKVDDAYIKGLPTTIPQLKASKSVIESSKDANKETPINCK